MKDKVRILIILIVFGVALIGGFLFNDVEYVEAGPTFNETDGGIGITLDCPPPEPGYPNNCE